MTSETTPASAGSNSPAARLRVRRRRRAAALGVLIALWPAMLQIELLPLRAESLRVLGPAGGQGQSGRHAGPRAGGARPAAMSPPLPSAGALPSDAAAIVAAQLPPIVDENTPVRLVDLALTGPGSIDPGVEPSSSPFTPPPGLTSPGGPGVTGPERPTTPASPPPSGPPDPPVTNPTDPTDPRQPPIVSPPSDPPVIGPSPPSFPGVPGGPGGPQTISPTNPRTDEPGGGPDGHQPPVSGVPEPAVWLQMILGTALLGAAMRRRRRLQPTALRA